MVQILDCRAGPFAERRTSVRGLNQCGQLATIVDETATIACAHTLPDYQPEAVDAHIQRIKIDKYAGNLIALIAQFQRVDIVTVIWLRW